MATPAEIITSLIDRHGLTEQEIADELRQFGVRVTQATINRLKTGAHASTKFEIGMGLVQLHERISKVKHPRTATSVPRVA